LNPDKRLEDFIGVLADLGLLNKLPRSKPPYYRFDSESNWAEVAALLNHREIPSQEEASEDSWSWRQAERFFEESVRPLLAKRERLFRKFMAFLEEKKLFLKDSRPEVRFKNIVDMPRFHRENWGDKLAGELNQQGETTETGEEWDREGISCFLEDYVEPILKAVLDQEKAGLSRKRRLIEEFIVLGGNGSWPCDDHWSDSSHSTWEDIADELDYLRIKTLSGETWTGQNAGWPYRTYVRNELETRIATAHFEETKKRLQEGARRAERDGNEEEAKNLRSKAYEVGREIWSIGQQIREKNRKRKGRRKWS